MGSDKKSKTKKVDFHWVNYSTVVRKLECDFCNDAGKIEEVGM